MIDDLSYNPNELAGSMDMLQLARDVYFLLVEGVDELFFWKTRVTEQCELIETGGCANLKAVARILDDQQDQRALGVLDADLDRIHGIELSARLVYTDQRDLEGMLLASSALDRVLNQYLDKDKHKVFQQNHHSVLAKALAMAKSWGRLRYAHFCLSAPNKGMFFPGPRVSNYIDYDNLTVKEVLLQQDFCQRFNLSVGDLSECLKQSPLADVSDADLAQGHGLISIVNGILLKGAAGASLLEGNRKFTDKDLFERLCLAYHLADLCQTRMFQSLKQKADHWNLTMFPDCP